MQVLTRPLTMAEVRSQVDDLDILTVTVHVPLNVLIHRDANGLRDYLHETILPSESKKFILHHYRVVNFIEGDKDPTRRFEGSVTLEVSGEVDLYQPDDEGSLSDIDIPGEYLDLASQWYEGQDNMMYALSSTGDIRLGTDRPLNDDDQPMSDREWHVHLWECLSCDVGRAARLARESRHEDADDLVAFEEWVDETVDKLRAEYGLED